MTEADSPDVLPMPSAAPVPRRAKSVRCFYCRRKAVKLCDYLTRRPDGTCDRPLCQEHAHNVGHWHVCGGKYGGYIETVDYCPGHYETHKRTVIP